MEERRKIPRESHFLLGFVLGFFFVLPWKPDSEFAVSAQTEKSIGNSKI